MKWRNHRLVTAATIFSLTGHLLPTAIAMYGSVFPDAVEGDDYSSLEWQQNHRKLSHLMIVYIAALAGLYFYFGRLFYFLNQNELTIMVSKSLESKDPKPMILVAGYCATWFIVGCIMHLLEDMFCGGVPIFETDKRFGYRLFKVNTPRENVIAFVISAALIAWRYYTIEPFCLGL